MERYEYVGQAGSGAYGQVWVCKVRPVPEGEVATDGLVDGMLVACKVFRQAHTDKEIMRLALREVRMLKAVSHTNCVKLLDAFRSKSGRVYLIFEYITGSAYKEISTYRQGLPPQNLKLLAFQLCLSLRYLHSEKMVHRDLKPANILIDDAGVVKLCDFGFARFTNCADPRDAERMSSYVVTRWYRAPEVLLSMEYGPAADIWAMGCTIAELAMGEPLMPGTSTVDQLWRIMRIFGALPPHMAARTAEDPRLAAVRAPPRGRTLAVRIARVGPRLVQFLEACLRLEPRSRPTADELLRMPYFFEIPSLVKGTVMEEHVMRELASPGGPPKPLAAAAAAAAAAAKPTAGPAQAAASHVPAPAAAGPTPMEVDSKPPPPPPAVAQPPTAPSAAIPTPMAVDVPPQPPSSQQRPPEGPSQAQAQAHTQGAGSEAAQAEHKVLTAGPQQQVQAVESSVPRAVSHLNASGSCGPGTPDASAAQPQALSPAEMPASAPEPPPAPTSAPAPEPAPYVLVLPPPGPEPAEPPPRPSTAPQPSTSSPAAEREPAPTHESYLTGPAPPSGVLPRPRPPSAAQRPLSGSTQYGSGQPSSTHSHSASIPGGDSEAPEPSLADGGGCEATLGGTSALRRDYTQLSASELAAMIQVGSGPGSAHASGSQQGSLSLRAEARAVLAEADTALHTAMGSNGGRAQGSMPGNQPSLQGWAGSHTADGHAVGVLALATAHGGSDGRSGEHAMPALGQSYAEAEEAVALAAPAPPAPVPSGGSGSGDGNSAGGVGAAAGRGRRVRALANREELGRLQAVEDAARAQSGAQPNGAVPAPSGSGPVAWGLGSAAGGPDPAPQPSTSGRASDEVAFEALEPPRPQGAPMVVDLAAFSAARPPAPQVGPHPGRRAAPTSAYGAAPSAFAGAAASQSRDGGISPPYGLLNPLSGPAAPVAAADYADAGPHHHGPPAPQLSRITALQGRLSAQGRPLTGSFGRMTSQGIVPSAGGGGNSMPRPRLSLAGGTMFGVSSAAAHAFPSAVGLSGALSGDLTGELASATSLGHRVSGLYDDLTQQVGTPCGAPWLPTQLPTGQVYPHRRPAMLSRVPSFAVLSSCGSHISGTWSPSGLHTGMGASQYSVDEPPLASATSGGSPLVAYGLANGNGSSSIGPVGAAGPGGLANSALVAAQMAAAAAAPPGSRLSLLQSMRNAGSAISRNSSGTGLAAVAAAGDGADGRPSHSSTGYLPQHDGGSTSAGGRRLTPPGSLSGAAPGPGFVPGFGVALPRLPPGHGSPGSSPRTAQAARARGFSLSGGAGDAGAAGLPPVLSGTGEGSLDPGSNRSSRMSMSRPEPARSASRLSNTGTAPQSAAAGAGVSPRGTPSALTRTHTGSPREAQAPGGFTGTGTSPPLLRARSKLATSSGVRAAWDESGAGRGPSEGGAEADGATPLQPYRSAPVDVASARTPSPPPPEQPPQPQPQPQPPRAVQPPAQTPPRPAPAPAQLPQAPPQPSAPVQLTPPPPAKLHPSPPPQPPPQPPAALKSRASGAGGEGGKAPRSLLQRAKAKLQRLFSTSSSSSSK